MTVKRVILIRPGETDWNKSGRWQGWVASPLNAHGRRQAQSLARYIRNIGISALYTSDLRRALETAEILAAELGYRPVPDARWRERDIGKWQGLTPVEMRDWYAVDYQQLLDNRDSYRVPGGESRADVRRRVLEAFQAVLKEDKGGTIAIISHTTATHMLLLELIPGYDVYNTVLGNTSVTTIALGDDDLWRVITANDLSHLEGLPSNSVGELENKK